jgi:hypothetical protein
VNEELYGIRVTTILSAADKLTAELEYLCALIEHPDPEFAIADAVVYGHAIVAVATQLDFIANELSENELNEDETHVKLSKDEVMMLNAYNSTCEEALSTLEEICGISLQNN